MAYNEALQTPKKAGKSLVLRQLGEKVRFSGKEAGFVNFLNKPKQDADVEKELEEEETGI